MLILAHFGYFGSALQNILRYLMDMGDLGLAATAEFAAVENQLLLHRSLYSQDMETL